MLCFSPEVEGKMAPRKMILKMTVVSDQGKKKNHGISFKKKSFDVFLSKSIFYKNSPFINKFFVL